MTNTENPAPNFTVTATVPDSEWDQPEMAFRVLSWIERQIKFNEAGVDLEGFSQPRQESVADLIRHGLVTEKFYHDELDGLRTLQISEAGQARLQAVWALASAKIVQPVGAN